jgi:hypothetical protein
VRYEGVVPIAAPVGVIVDFLCEWFLREPDVEYFMGVLQVMGVGSIVIQGGKCFLI